MSKYQTDRVIEEAVTWLMDAVGDEALTVRWSEDDPDNDGVLLVSDIAAFRAAVVALTDDEGGQ